MPSAKRVLSVRGGNPYTRSLKDLPVTNLTVFEALIFIFSPVFGLTPVRALRDATLKVPNPISCTTLGFFYARLDSIDNGIHSALSISFAASEGFLYGGNEFDFVHLDERSGKDEWRLCI